VRWQIEPLGGWPYNLTDPRRSSGVFKAGWDNTLALLQRELDYLDVTGAVAIRIDADPSQLRRDGMLRAHARVEFPGVIVSFASKHGPLTYASDTHERVWGHAMPGWQANVRAIALGLEALRAVDRYGITRSGEQYRGWTAIEAGPASSFATTDEAVRWLCQQAGWAYAANWSQEGAATLLKVVAKKLHPDLGGDPAEWTRYDHARQLLTGSAT
jgi:hypothetical protein